MDFQLSDEAAAVQGLARDFADKILRPRVADYRRTGEFPDDVLQELAKWGLLGGRVPEAWGGSGMSYESYAVMVEELSMVDNAMAGQASQPSGLLGMGILKYGTDQQKDEYLRPLCTGARVGSVAMSEIQSGSDVANMQTRATAHGDGFRINGQKTFVSHVGEADFFVTFAQTDPALGRKGICAFLLEASTPGITVVPIEDVGVTIPHSWGQVFFDDVEVSAEQLLGQPGDGLRVAMSALEVGRIAIAARAVGAARECLRAAVAFAKEREAYGQSIGRYQHIQRRLADILISVSAARMLTFQAAAEKDAGVEDARVDAAAAKIYAARMLEEVASSVVDIFAGAGLTTDYPWVQYMKDAKALQIAEGTVEIQYVQVAETILGYRRGGTGGVMGLL